VRRSGVRPTTRFAAAALAVASALILESVPVHALDQNREDVAAFIGEMQARYGFESAALVTLFAQVESKPAIIDAISRPAEKVMPWYEYRARFMTDRRIARGRDVARDQAAALQKAACASGVPGSILLGIVGIETFYGEMTGKHRVIDALSTLAFDYPPRSRFFRGELEQFLLMTREEAIDPLAPLGSYAGAMGIPQFMPTSFRSFAVDGSGDGHRDLWSDWSDVFASVGNYLKVHGWRTGEPIVVSANVEGANLDGIPTDTLELTTTVGALRTRGVKFDTGLADDAPAVLIALQGESGLEYRVGFSNFYAITRYNRSAMYASVVADLADAVQQPPPPVDVPPMDVPPPDTESVPTAGPVSTSGPVPTAGSQLPQDAASAARAAAPITDSPH
jgi:peptidoglycan lytic transglycosylase B